jgi:DNA-binding response OmpR family regulator
MSSIYILDDDPDIVAILKMMLQTQGYQVNATTNPGDILECTGDKHDLILLDLWMSGTDGRDILASLRTQDRTKDIPVIFVSASSQLKEIAAEHDVAGYIEKPFDMALMLDKVKDILARNN